jgi:hypothetical protein
MQTVGLLRLKFTVLTLSVLGSACNTAWTACRARGQHTAAGVEGGLV